MLLRKAALAVGLALLGACVPRAVPPEQPTPPEPVQPQLPPRLHLGATAGPPVAGLAISEQAAAAALAAFRISCPSLTRREDTSRLTRPSDWAQACTAAATWPAGSSLGFFATHLEAVEVEGGKAFATGYFEPQIAGSRVRAPGYEVPIYRKPPDLLEVNPLTGEKMRGRLNERGEFVPYFERAEIEDGALAGRGLELAWAADPVDLFFLEIQGSGRLSLPDGGVMRIGYAGQNGREYVAIGKIMRERGLLQPGHVNMQSITAWLRAHPEEGRAIMRENKSYIFFHELTGPGPLGALGLPVTGRVSVAADPRYVPLGAPVFLHQLSRPEANGLWVAQDTGGAIKGANRFDTFWGAGEEAARIAGGMQAEGRALLLLPKGTLARLEAEARSGTPTQR